MTNRFDVIAMLQGGDPPDDGVVGFVDALLLYCSRHGLTLDWQDGRCAFLGQDGKVRNAIDVAVPRSAFRAALARLAVLCNDQIPHSVNSYGGSGELRTEDGKLAVSFSNQPDALWLRLQPGLPAGRSSVNGSHCSTEPQVRAS